MSDFTITENLEDDRHGRYEIVIDGIAQAYMRFSRLERILILHHTEVKPSLRGKGAAKQLLNYAVEDARSRSLKINALCPFSRKTLESSSEYNDVYSEA